MRPLVHITGIGIISALGDDVPANLDALLNERTGIGPITRLSTRHSVSLPAAEVKHDNTQLAALSGLDKPYGWTRTALLGMKAVQEAIKHSGLDPIGPRIGFISASTAGGMDGSEGMYGQFFTEPPGPDAQQWVATHDPGEHTERIAAELGITGFVTTISTACSSSANAIMLGARLIRSGKLDVVIAGGSDALSRYTVNGFNSLMILDHALCRPMDRSRAGLNLGEAAAYVVLESEAHAQARNAISIGQVNGYANTNDAFHATASSPEGEGAYLAMSQALLTAGLKSEDIDHINVHGTGTLNNDLSESRALIRLFGDRLPPFTSTKTFTGHTLAAAGAVEAIYALLSIEHGVLFANLRFEHPLVEVPIVPVLKTTHGQRIRHVLSSSFGFGGNNTSLVISAPR
ncbi:MAG: beta-ketoacyl-[acyl-carrier-protein] synthase family protein [Flavobacteriales bacterium]|nr:beta-ketoacyl-[acyl-carrier-protein] synthase family protein [Flavobacteriales bacterium]